MHFQPDKIDSIEETSLPSRYRDQHEISSACYIIIKTLQNNEFEPTRRDVIINNYRNYTENSRNISFAGQTAFEEFLLKFEAAISRLKQENKIKESSSGLELTEKWSKFEEALTRWEDNVSNKFDKEWKKLLYSRSFSEEKLEKKLDKIVKQSVQKLTREQAEYIIEFYPFLIDVGYNSMHRSGNAGMTAPNSQLLFDEKVLEAVKKLKIEPSA